MSKFDDFFKSGRNVRGGAKSDYEFYEDTHNEKGEYVGPAPAPEPIRFTPERSQKQERKVLPTDSDYVAPRTYQSVVVYSPKNHNDVQSLIDFLRRREPAVVNLDSAEEGDAQRILDFVCGAIYALNGTVHRIASNIFLLSPEGVEITIPYDQE